ncbi:MAG: hypothetical protein E7364_03085 [Clostridiales bacterium]|nr:hypothetical protein [Clostridiales bacterium]
MNNWSNQPTEKKKNRLSIGKAKDLLILAGLGLALIFASWKIFQGDTKTSDKTVISMTATEQKIARLLEEIDGVGDASVIVCETEEEVKSVVVVCEGADNLRVMLNVREAVSAALGTEQNVIKIYLKKE